MIVAQRRSLLGVVVLIAAACSGSTGGDHGDEVGAPVASPGSTGSLDAATTVAPTTSGPVTTVAPTTTGPAEPECVVTVVAGDSLSAIVDDADLDGVEDLRAENWLAEGHVIHRGDELDVCIGNDVDDVTGASRLPPSPSTVRRQQRRLNELFAPYIISDLAIDGDSGSVTVRGDHRPADF